MQSVVSGKSNTKKKSARAADAWLPNAVIVCLGGMLYTILSQWFMQLGGAYWEDGHLIDPDVKLWLMVPASMLCIYCFFVRNGGFIFEPRVSPMRDAENAPSTNLTLLVVTLISLAILIGTFPVSAAWTISTSVLCGLGLIFLAFLHLVYSAPLARTYAVLTWLLGYLTLWVVSSTVSHVSIYIFVAVWVVLGALGGNTVCVSIRNRFRFDRENAGHVWRQKDIEPATIKQSRRARMTSSVVSQYGRIPQDTFDLLNQHVRRVTGPIASSIPLGASEEARNITIREILDVTLRDWRENDNLKGLQPVDIDDIRSFVEAAIAITGSGSDPVTLAAYKISLRALMLDWLDNWNVEGQSGPPLRNYR